jgi:hypothetical protein
MSTASAERLFGLLPAVHRIRDADEGEPLRALLGVIGEQFALMEEDLDRLYDNFFIETCEEWVVPYLGDLLGVEGVIPTDAGVFTQRGYVANTLAYRRAKGTAAVLEQLARDVTGWPAKAIEYFDRLATTAHMNHERRTDIAFVELRDADTSELGGGPFDPAAHTVDVRHIDNERGRHNIPNVGIHLWRLQSYVVPLDMEERGPERLVVGGAEARPVEAATAAGEGRFHANPLGVDAPLFNVPRAERAITELAAEANVPGALRRLPLHDELERRRQAIADGVGFDAVWFDDRQPVIRVALDDAEVPPERIVICGLGDPDPPIPEGWPRPPAQKTYRRSADNELRTQPISVAVDPVRGRVALPAGETAASVQLGYAYGLAGDLGGGPYDRRASLSKALPPRGSDAPRWQIGVTKGVRGTMPDDLVGTLGDALLAWNDEPPGTWGVIAVMDSRSYEEDLVVRIPAGSRLVIAAADWPPDEEADSLGVRLRTVGRVGPSGLRPHLRGTLDVEGEPGDEAGALMIDGLLLEKDVTVKPGNLGSLRLAHTTIAPRTATLLVDADDVAGKRNNDLTVTLERAICGPVTLDPGIQGLHATDSIFDGGIGELTSSTELAEGTGAQAIAAPDVRLDACTVLGRTSARTLHASNCLFTSIVEVERRQTGCVRYSYLPLASVVPRRFECEPRDEAAAKRVAPTFTSVTHGEPGYGQLGRGLAPELAHAADDDGEVGAFHFLQQPQRLANLEGRLDEYLRFGLEAGVFLVT